MLASSLQTPDHVVHAERLGYRRAWCSDNPAVHSDMWMALALAAQLTTDIGLGTAVMVPSLRHPLVSATATATLAELAPGRVAVAVGTGFVGRLGMGQRPLPWADVTAYVRTFRALLAGEDAEWEGRAVRMLHAPGFAASRPIDVPVLIAAVGPKGLRLAAELGDGIVTAGPSLPEVQRPRWWVHWVGGTVLEAGEDLTSERVLAAAGPAFALNGYHFAYELAGSAAVAQVPGGHAWLAEVESVSASMRHLTVHEGHLVAPNEADRKAWTSGGSAALTQLSFSGTANQIRQRLAELEAAGVTEVGYTPTGPDIEGELTNFAQAAGL